MKRVLLSLIALAACAVAPVLADDEPDGQYEQGRAVARISVLNGDVSIRRGDSGDVVAAAVNGPVMADDRILTGASSRAEVELDFANVIRIGPGSEVRFSGMDVKNFQIQVAAGTVTFRVLRPSQAQSEVDTPSVAVHPLRQGIYRVTVREDGASEITVRSGEAEVYSSNGSERLTAGQTMNARGSGADTEFQIVAAIPPDSLDRWSDDRDRFMLRSQSYQHVSPDVYGAEDLDQYGQWVNDPSYGYVWQPTVPPGWAPYRDGRWVWEDYYGWTWVSSDPWGWAPYHYGRWFWGPAGWYWYPGPVYARYYWSPALVGFFGFGGGFGVGFGGFGGVGWVPLAPFEVFYPWWGRGFYGGFRNGVFVNRTTIVNNVNVTNVYRNAAVTGAVTGSSTGNFTRGAQFTALNRSQLQQAGAVHGVLPVAPDRASLRMSDRAAGATVASSRASSFASHAQTASVQHFSFDQQQRGMQQFSRGNFGSAAGAAVSGAGNSSGLQRSAPATSGGWQRTGDRPAATTGGGFSGTNSAPGANSSTVAHGWGRFGEPIHGTTSGTTGGATGGSAGSAAPQSPSANSNRGGWQTFQNPRPNGPANFAGSYSGGQPVRISPPIVQQRTPGYQSPRYSAPGTGTGGTRSGGARSGGGGHNSGGHR